MKQNEKLKNDLEIDTVLPKALKYYNHCDFELKQRVRFIYYLCISAFSFIIPIMLYTAILQFIDSHGLELPILFAEVSIAVIFLGSIQLLIRGYYQVAAHTIIAFSLVCIWFIIINNDISDPIRRLDTVVYIFPVLFMIPIFLSKNKLIIPLYVLINLGVLVVVLLYIDSQRVVSSITLVEYYFDVAVAIVFTGVVGYNSFLINKLSLDKANVDIEKRKEAERSLQKSEQKYREMTELLPQTVFEYTVDGKLTYVNKSGLKLFGYSQDDFKKGVDLSLVIAPESREEALKNIEDVLTGKISTGNEYVGIKKDGTKFPMIVFSSKIEEADQIIGLRGIIVDISERKISEKALHDSYEKIKNIMDAASFSTIISTDTNGIIQTLNSGAELMLGYKAEEIIGICSPLIFHKKNEIDSASKYLYEKYGVEIIGFETFVYELNYKITVEKEWTYVRKDGTELIVNLVISAITDENGFLSGYLGVARDITESKITQVKIKESEKKYRTLMESMKEAVIQVDNDDTVLFVNKSFTEALGYSNDDILGKKGYEVLLNEKQHGFIIDNNNKRKDGLSDQYEISFKSKDGTWRDFFVSASPVIDNLGVVSGSIGVMTDITDKKIFEKELKLSEEKFKNLFNSMPSGYYRSTPEGRFVDANPAFISMLGYKNLEELKNIFIPHTIYVDPSERISLFKDNPQLIDKVERYRLKRKDGQIIWIEENSRYIKDENGKVLFNEGICKDITFELEAEIILRKSEERYRLIAENSTDMISKHSLDGKFIYVSPSCKKILGYEQEELIGQSPYNFFHPDDLEPVSQSHHRILSSEMVDVITYRFRKKDGAYIWFETTSTTLYDGVTGNPTEIQTASRDISQRILIEELKHRSEQNFRKIFETAPFGIVISENNPPNKILEVNDAHLRMINKRKEDVIGQPAPKLLKEESVVGIQSEMATKGFVDDFAIETKVGDEKKHFSISARPIEYDDQTAILNVILDITSKKMAEKELRNFGQFVQHIINSLPVIVISLNNKKEVTLYNNASFKYLANPDQRCFSKMFPSLNFIEPLLTKSINNNEVVNDTQMLLGKEGEAKYFNIAISPIQEESESGCVILIKDVTETKQVEQLMIQNEKMSSVAGLAAGMAHEINNPLGTIVQGCQNIIRRTNTVLPRNLIAADKVGVEIEQIQNYFKEREIDKIIASIGNAAGKASEIIKNMLQFSRKSESKKVNYRLDRLIEETIDLANNDYSLKKKYDFRSIKIEREYDNNLPEIWMTVTEIQQVIFNMLQNSAQAMRKESSIAKSPKINIRVNTDVDWLRIEIEDNGPGMDEKVRLRVFEPFFTTKEIGEGTGLGLSVSYMIIKNNHNGNIEVSSLPGVGTKFIIKLPLQRRKHE